MLLSLMRKHAKSWLIKALIAIIAVVFVFYFGYSFTSDQAMKIAYVNGELINGAEYEKAYQDMLTALQARYKSMWNDNLIKVFNLKNRALESLITQRLMSQAARELGLDVTEEEVQNAIMNYPAFQINGHFDMRRYQNLLSANHMNPEDFETGITSELLDKKIKQFLFAFLNITDREILEYYTFANEKVKISFVEFNPEKYEKSLKIDAARLKQYFEKNKEQYRVPEKISVTYLEIDPKSFLKEVETTEKEIESYYEYNADMYRHPKEVKARHILFKVGPDDTEEVKAKIKSRAEKVLEKARKGEDFAALAKKYSEGPSKSKGGDLGYFKAGEMEAPFEEAAFALKKGEISGLVLTRFGYHIILVEDIKEAGITPLKKVRDDIVATLAGNIATELAHEKGLTLLDQMPYDVDLAVYGNQNDITAKKSAYFSKNRPIPDIKGSEKIAPTLFSLEKDEASGLIELGGKFYIFQTADSKASYLPELKDVKEAVEKKFMAQEARAAAESAAEKYLKALREGKSWETAAKENNLKVQQTQFFTRRDPIPDIGNAPALNEMAFKLNKDNPYTQKPFVNDKGAFVVRWEGNEGIDDKKFQEEKEAYRDSLTQTKHQRIFESWIKNLRTKAEIEIVSPVDGNS
ncbi:MAG: SurA N-terminal domain-containing protein [Deltaproteobacteria bacterium]|nr:SurA N-terminal domain-containing protein [Deltaproteobacteria bacterium]